MRVVVSTIVVLILGVASAIDAQSRNLVDIVACNEDAQRRANTASASPGPRQAPPTLAPERGTRTDPSGSIVTEAPDPLLEGMAVDGLTDPVYRTAYRACMAARSGRER